MEIRTLTVRIRGAVAVTALAAASATAAPAGYPGDVFEITNVSAGDWVASTAVVSWPDGRVERFAAGAAGEAVGWTPPLDAPVGIYRVDLELETAAGTTVSTAGTGTVDVTVCGAPLVEAAVTSVAGQACTSCTAALGDSVSAAAVAQGHPVSLFWTAQRPDGAWEPVGGDTAEIAVTLPGTYRLWVVAGYAHQAPEDPRCSEVGGLTPSATYRSCAAVEVTVARPIRTLRRHLGERRAEPVAPVIP